MAATATSCHTSLTKTPPPNPQPERRGCAQRYGSAGFESSPRGGHFRVARTGDRARGPARRRAPEAGRRMNRQTAAGRGRIAAIRASRPKRRASDARHRRPSSPPGPHRKAPAPTGRSSVRSHQDPDQVRTNSASHQTFPPFVAGQKGGWACTTSRRRTCWPSLPAIRTHRPRTVGAGAKCGTSQQLSP